MSCFRGVLEANLNQRVLSDAGKLHLGAHLLLKPGDVAMAHGFIGFFGDMRLLQQSIEGSKLAAWTAYSRPFQA